MTGYQYQGTGRSLTPAQAAEAARRNGLAPPGAARPPAPDPAPAKALKGAVKVGGFPERSKYPWREIAADGGIWRIDGGAFGVKKAESIRAAACAWAKASSLTAKTAVDGGALYVQFTKGGA